MSKSELTGREARQELYAVMNGSSPFKQKVKDALCLGRDCLGVDVGVFSRIDEETNSWEELVSTLDPEAYTKSNHRSFEETYCRLAIEENASTTILDAKQRSDTDNEIAEDIGFSCYLGTPVMFDGEIYGTVCFFAEDARTTAFEEGEEMFAELITQLIQQELERDRADEELMRKSNLVNVLNRVLRHNLRNDMSVVRGRINLLSDEMGGNRHADIAIENVDSLLALSEKARDLERIVTEDGRRRKGNIVEITEGIVNDFRNRFPHATFNVEAEAEVIAPIFASFEQAIEELLQNAVKHGTDTPFVRVTVKNVQNGIEIQVADDGSGISDQEQRVLQTGVETPLVHGSGLGLWIVNWIVTAHNGQISVESSEGGTTMTVFLPRLPNIEGETKPTEVERANDRYESAFKQASDAMVVTDDQGLILDVNPRATELAGVDKEEFLGRSLRSLVEDSFNFEEAWKAVEDGGVERETAPILTDTDEELDLEYSATKDIVPGQHLFIAREVTKRAPQNEDGRVEDIELADSVE